MDSNEQMEKLHMELTEKAYKSFFLGCEVDVRCPICNEVVQVWEKGSCYGADCKCGFMNDLNRGL